MRVDRITFEMACDFHADLVCEHCGATQKLTTGYHDRYYHSRVLPAITCQTCGKQRDGTKPETPNDQGREPV